MEQVSNASSYSSLIDNFISVLLPLLGRQGLDNPFVAVSQLLALPRVMTPVRPAHNDEVQRPRFRLLFVLHRFLYLIWYLTPSFPGTAVIPTEGQFLSP